MEEGLKTIGATAVEFGINRKTVADLVRILGIQPKSMTNGKAKGLSAADRRAIKERLKPRKAALSA